MAASFPVGPLAVTLIRAADLHDIQLLGKMSPYAKLSVGQESFASKKHEKGGKNPEWQQAFMFNLSGKEDILHILIFDSELLRDGHIGRCDVALNALLAAGADKEQWWPVESPDLKKEQGRVLLKAKFNNAQAGGGGGGGEVVVIARQQAEIASLQQAERREERREGEVRQEERREVRQEERREVRQEERREERREHHHHG